MAAYLLFDDNKIKIAGKKQKKNSVGYTRDGKYEKEI